MLVKPITYVDYNGVERTETFYFNLTKAELMEMQADYSGSLEEILTKIVEAKDGPTIMKFVKELIVRSYGVKSLDGRKIVKNDEVLNDFLQTEAYSELYMELITDAAACADFANGIIPKGLVKYVDGANSDTKSEIVTGLDTYGTS